MICKKNCSSGVFRTLSIIYDGAFFVKQLTNKHPITMFTKKLLCRCSQKSSFVEVWHGTKYLRVGSLFCTEKVHTCLNSKQAHENAVKRLYLAYLRVGEYSFLFFYFRLEMNTQHFHRSYKDVNCSYSTKRLRWIFYRINHFNQSYASFMLKTNLIIGECNFSIKYHISTWTGNLLLPFKFLVFFWIKFQLYPCAKKTLPKTIRPMRIESTYFCLRRQFFSWDF